MEFRVQISPDGLNWLDHEGIQPLVIDAEGFHSIPVERFGHWLRLRSTRLSGATEPVLRIYLEFEGVIGDR